MKWHGQNVSPYLSPKTEVSIQKYSRFTQRENASTVLDAATRPPPGLRNVEA